MSSSYCSEIPQLFVHEIPIVVYDVINVIVLHLKLMRFHLRNTNNFIPTIVLTNPFLFSN